MVRCFTNIELNEEQRANIVELITQLKPAGGKVKWVEPENLHLTLNFFGEVLPSQVEQLKNEFEQALTSENGFQVSLKGVGAFPNFDYPRVFWVGVEKGAEEARNISKKLSESITVGLKDKKKFHPHITIGRVKFSELALINKLKEFESADFGESTVTKVNIKKSELTPQGAVYEIIKEIPLTLLTP